MVRVLEIFGEPISNGGQESFVFNVIQNMNIEGLHIDAFTPYYCDNIYYQENLKKIGGSVISIGLPFLPGKSRANIYKPILNYLEKSHYDVVHIHSGSISVLAIGAAAAKKAGVKKIIVHSHCAAEKKTMKYRMVKLLTMPWMDHCPTNYLACSKIAGEWKFSKRVVNRKLKILKNGVDLDKFQFDPEKRNEIRTQLDIDHDAFVLGHVGRFSYQKNHEYLIEVFRRVREKIGKCKLILIGSGENEVQIRNLVKEYKIENDVLFVGNVNNVNDYLQAMDVFALPSRYEGLPIVGVEAQAAGLPLVVSDKVSDEIRISPNVYYLSLDHMDQWVDTVCTLSRQPRVNNRECMIRAGYDIKQSAEELRHIYLYN